MKDETPLVENSKMQATAAMTDTVMTDFFMINKKYLKVFIYKFDFINELLIMITNEIFIFYIKVFLNRFMFIKKL